MLNIINMNSLNGFSIFSQGFGTAGMLKSTQEKSERQQNMQSQISFWENQKENLKNIQCDSLEDIAKKLEMFHSYEDQISAVKKQYNNEQMRHAMDEARERGEQIAENIEDTTPKTKEEMLEEALGIEGQDGLLEVMEDVEELPEDMENVKELQEEFTEDMLEEISKDSLEDMSSPVVPETEKLTEWEQMPEETILYKRFDVLV